MVDIQCQTRIGDVGVLKLWASCGTSDRTQWSWKGCATRCRSSPSQRHVKQLPVLLEMRLISIWLLHCALYGTPYLGCPVHPWSRALSEISFYFLKRNRVTTPTCQPMDILYNLCKYTPPLLLDILRYFRGVDKSNRVVYPSLAFLGDGPSLGFPGERIGLFGQIWVSPCRVPFWGRLWKPSWNSDRSKPRLIPRYYFGVEAPTQLFTEAFFALYE